MLMWRYADICDICRFVICSSALNLKELGESMELVLARCCFQRIEGIREHGCCRIVEIETMYHGLRYLMTVRTEAMDMERVVVLMNCVNSSLVIEFTLSLQ